MLTWLVPCDCHMPLVSMNSISCCRLHLYLKPADYISSSMSLPSISQLLSYSVVLCLTKLSSFLLSVSKQPWIYPLSVNLPYHGKALNSIICVDVPFRNCSLTHSVSDLEFSRLESWSQDVSRPIFTSLGLGLGLGTLESWSWSWDCIHC